MNMQCKNGHKLFWRMVGHIRDLLICAGIANFISFMFHFDPDVLFSNFWMNSLYGAAIGGAIWKGNEAIGYILSKYIDLTLEPKKALVWNISVMFIYSVFAIIIVNFVWFVVMGGKSADFLLSQWFITMVIEMGITLIIGSIMFSIGFFNSWRAAVLKEEALKRESLAFQYKALKNQVNPHFLFNSLNTLSSLVYKDQETAVRFIKQLSEVYRYVLAQKDKELVTMEEEIEFVEKYTYLQKIRHGDSLSVEINIEPNKNYAVIPLSIQMLVENAIKHNVVAEEEPLSIKIGIENGFLEVINNLNKKNTIETDGGTGLSNLRSRYGYLSDKKIEIIETQTEYIVRIPLIKYQKDESIDY